MSDPAKYRTKEELENYKELDPIERVKSTLLTKKYATASEIEKLETEIEKTVDASVVFAEESPYPDASELYTDVYVEDYPYIIE